MLGHVYTATFSAIAVSAAQDLFEIVAPADGRVIVQEIFIGQYSDFGDAAAEMLGLTILRGHTTSGSGGAAVTPSPLDPYLRAAGATVERNNTTVATAGSPVTIWADSFNIRGGWYWRARDRGGLQTPALGILLQPSQRLVVRVTAPADALTTNGTLVFEEVGTAPVD